MTIKQKVFTAYYAAMLFINLPHSKFKLNGCIIWLERLTEAKFQLFGMQKPKA